MENSVFCLLCLVLSFAVLAAAIGFAVYKVLKNGDKEHTAVTPFRVLLVGFFVAAVLFFYPVYYIDYFAAESGFTRLFKSFIISVHNSMRLFILDGEFDIIRDFFGSYETSAALSVAYTVYASVLYVIAPVLTAGFVLSFFKSAKSLVKYAFSLSTEIYIISALNDKSVALATDVREKSANALIVFANVYEDSEGKNADLIAQAKLLKAVTLSRDVAEISLKPRKKRAVRKIYFISEDEDENLNKGLELITRCRSDERLNTENTAVYVFATATESEILLNSIDNGKVKVRRINERRNLVLHTLIENSIFQNALPPEAGESEKQINVVIVGLGGYGKEYLKSVCWCSQMPGYKLTVHVFDKDGDIMERLAYDSPELITYNDKVIDGEPYYKIIPHENCDTRSSKFMNDISALKGVTVALISLGNDELNIEAAIRMRMQLLRRKKEHGETGPDAKIFAIVYNPVKVDMVGDYGLRNARGADYNITFIGDTRERFSIKNIEQAELESDALQCHMQWVNREDKAKYLESLENFNRYEYYRRSSTAQAIYTRFKQDLGFNEKEGNDEEAKAYNEMLKKYEHRRWSAFMRTEGYVGSKAGRDELAKMHPDLIPYDALTEAAKAKDSVKLK